MNIQQYFPLNRSSLRCLVFVGVAFAVAIAVISLNHALMTILLSFAIAVGLWRWWEYDLQRMVRGQIEQIAQVEKHYQTEIETRQAKLDQLSAQSDQNQLEIANYKQQISEITQALNTREIAYQNATQELEALKAEYSQHKESAHALLDEAIANEEKVAQLESDRDRLVLKVQQLEQELEQQITERESDRTTIQTLTEQVTQSKQTLARLEQERTKYQETTASNQPTRDITARPFNMDDMRFAKIATIKLDPLPHPKILIEATETHYHQRNGGYDPAPITLNSIAEYLRHRYSNYDDLCRELGSYNEKARNVLKCRVNTAIWTALSSLDIQLED